MIHFQVEMESLKQIESALGTMRDKSKMVLRTAINNTAKETVKLLADEAQNEYYITKNAVKKSMTTDKATVGKLYALITSTGHTNELYGFKVSPKSYNPSNRPPAGHTGNVKRSNSPGYLYLMPGAAKDKYKAFVVKYTSGHLSIAQRVPGTTMQSDPTKEGIKNMNSISTPKMLGYEQGVFGVVEPKMYVMLHENIEAQILRYLG